MAHWIERHPDKELFYSDEFKSNPGSDKFSPFFKPEFDPFLSINCCYHTHLMAFKASALRRWRAYEDDRDTWCHDWDALTRAWAAGSEPVHVPELLYAWRIHPGSTAANGSAVKPSTVASQQHVLRRLVRARDRHQALEVVPNSLAEDSGMWSLSAFDPVQGVAELSAAVFWSTPRRHLADAIASGASWLFPA
jgi:hypothetical protein